MSSDEKGDCCSMASSEMKSVLACLQGGLGNQCFIYATARALSLRSHARLSIGCDYLLEDRIYKRKLALDAFECICDVRPPKLKIIRLMQKVGYRLLCDRLERLGNLCIDRRPFCYRPLPIDWHGVLTLAGYWQSEKYFYDIRDQLLKDFRLRDDAWVTEDPMALRIRAAKNSVFLHVRSYKEVPGKEDGQCARQMMDYYRKAIAYIVEHVENPVFFIFSDDIPFARELVSPLFLAQGSPACTYIEPLCSAVIPSHSKLPSAQIRDFTLMRMCKHGIVADSSFSWWAGWLGEQERLLKGEKPIRLHVNRRVMNDDFWPDRWVAI